MARDATSCAQSSSLSVEESTASPSVTLSRTSERATPYEQGEVERSSHQSATWAIPARPPSCSPEEGELFLDISTQDAILRRVGVATALKRVLSHHCTDIRMAITLASVCRLFRSMTLLSPQSWAVVSHLSRKGMDQLGIIMGRSAQLPLSLDLTFKPSETAVTLIEITRNIPRCRYLSLRIPEATSAQATSFNQLFSDVPATRLRRLRLEFADALPLVLPRKLFIGEAPRLREIQLRLGLLPSECPALHTVTTLIALDDSVQSVHIQRGFTLCPRLRHFRMNGIIPTAEFVGTAPATLVSLHIAETNLDGRTTQTVQFLRGLCHERIEEIRVQRVRIESLKFIAKTLFAIKEFGFLRKLEDDQIDASKSANACTSAHLLLEDEMRHLRIFSSVLAPKELEIQAFFQQQMCTTLVRLTLGDRLFARDVEHLQSHSRSLVNLRHVKIVCLGWSASGFEKGSISLFDLASRQSSGSRWDVPPLRSVGITSVNPFRADAAFRESQNTTVHLAGRSIGSLITWFSRNGPPEQVILEAIEVRGGVNQLRPLTGNVLVR